MTAEQIQAIQDDCELCEQYPPFMVVVNGFDIGEEIIKRMASHCRRLIKLVETLRALGGAIKMTPSQYADLIQSGAENAPDYVELISEEEGDLARIIERLKQGDQLMQLLSVDQQMKIITKLMAFLDRE